MKYSVLFLGAGPAILDSIPFQTRFETFSKRLCGHMITPVENSRHHQIRSIGAFQMHTMDYYPGSAIIRNGLTAWRTLSRALAIARGPDRFQVVVSPNPLVTGLVGWIIAKLTGAKLIIEVNGNFESAFKFGQKGQTSAGAVGRLKERVSHSLIPFVLKRADRVKLVYRNQLDPLRIRNVARMRTTSFPNIVAISKFIEHPKTDGKYILLAGFPWYLKGVDVLIKAFRAAAPKIPGYSLKIVGWCPEGREHFEQLAAGEPRIELLDAVYYDGIITLMTGCSLYVLASRTDSSPRVLREAMASHKPIIASNIDGVPDLVIDGHNGLLFRSEDEADLSAKIIRILTDPILAQTLADNGLRHVQDHLSEDRYLDHYHAMITETVGR